MNRSRRPRRPTRTLPRPDILIIDAYEPDLEVQISRNMFRGIAFAIDYDRVPGDIRERMQDEHVNLMRMIQSLARERQRATLQ